MGALKVNPKKSSKSKIVKLFLLIIFKLYTSGEKFRKAKVS